MNIIMISFPNFDFLEYWGDDVRKILAANHMIQKSQFYCSMIRNFKIVPFAGTLNTFIQIYYISAALLCRPFCHKTTF